MKKTTNVGMFVAIAFAIGMVGINFSEGSLNLQENTPASTMDGGSITGHIEIIHTDEDGNIRAYMQTDNAIVNDGRNCTAAALFGANTGCTDTTPGPYNVIGLGNGTALSGSTSQLLVNGETTGDGLARVTGTLGTFTNATADSAPAVQRISTVFTYSGSQASNPINQAGLFNTTSGTTSTFALKNFPSTVNMNSGDQLTVNWDITIDGTDTYS
jgi:hypothetical protein